MRALIFASLLLAAACAHDVPAKLPWLDKAPAPSPGESISFRLFKFLQDDGAERDTYAAAPGGGTSAKAIFSFRDRMQTVALGASFDIAADGSLRRYAAWGKTSRFTTIDDQVVVTTDGTVEIAREGKPLASVKTPPGPFAVASGYAPMLSQDLALRLWNQRGRPAKMQLLPEGELAIEARGAERYDNNGKPVSLEHVAVSGLVWGREDAWLDDQGALVAVVTRDAEFDHFEAVREGFDALLPELAKSTGADGVAWLAQLAKGAEHNDPDAKVIALTGGTLIDGTGTAPIADSIVLLEGDRILAAGPRGQIAIPAGAQTIDARGKWLVPGLWDMHAHVEQVEQGAVYLAAGVTTVRDMGNVLDFITGVRDAIDSGQGLGPRILVNGLVDGDGPAAVGVIRINSVEEIAPVVDRLKRAGCLEVKIYSSIKPALVKPIADYAHAHGMRVVGHVPFGMTPVEAIDAGFDSISHIHFLLDGLVPHDAAHHLSRAEFFQATAAIDLASAPVEAEVAAMAAHHVVLDDTIALVEQVLHTPEADAKREPGIATIPRELEATLGGIPPSLAPEADAAFEKTLALLGLLHRRGVAIVAGTDITVPGHSLHRELELYVRAGFTPMEALQAATLIPARVMHLEQESGTIAAGKRADLVVLNGDPLADISNVRRTSLVFAKGRAYDSAALWKLSGFRTLETR